MQRVMTKGWKAALAVFTMLAVAFSLFATSSAWASYSTGTQESKPGDPDYIEVEGVSYAKAESDSDVVLSVYTQAYGKSKQLVKQYTKAEIDALAAKSTTDPVAVIFNSNVGVTTSYVTSDALFADAGIAQYWCAGSAIDVENGKYGTYAYEDYANAKYYPKTTAANRDNEGAVDVPDMTFAVKEATTGIADDDTASQTVEKLLADPDKFSTRSALRVYVGASEENYAAGEKLAGNRMWSNIVSVTVLYQPKVYRLYNPNTGEHVYTAVAGERDNMVTAGWKYEGSVWKAPESSSTPVYRLYSGTDHHYTTSAGEASSLEAVGWKNEGIQWYADDDKSLPLFRVYNPNASVGAHHFTSSVDEVNTLVHAGWNFEGIGFYGIAV